LRPMNGAVSGRRALANAALKAADRGLSELHGLGPHGRVAWQPTSDGENSYSP
jgi:hypothetical protein